MKPQLETAPLHDQRFAVSPGQIRVQSKAKESKANQPHQAHHHTTGNQNNVLQYKIKQCQVNAAGKNRRTSQAHGVMPSWAVLRCAVLCCTVPNYLLARRRSTWIMSDFLYNDIASKELHKCEKALKPCKKIDGTEFLFATFK
jgi:hypothetical protein